MSGGEAKEIEEGKDVRERRSSGSAKESKSGTEDLANSRDVALSDMFDYAGEKVPRLRRLFFFGLCSQPLRAGLTCVVPPALEAI